jgi:presenilin-like A22 family membrane protease
MKKVLFFAFTSYVIGTLLALLFNYVIQHYSASASAMMVSPSGGGQWNLLIYGAITFLGIIALNIFLSKRKKDAEKHLGKFFNTYVLFLLAIFSIYLAVYLTLTIQVLWLPSTIYGSGVPAILILAGLFVTIAITFYSLWNDKRHNNAVALILGIMTMIMLAIFPPYFLIAFFGIMAVYDYIAVFRLKTMLTLANIALDKKNPLPLLIKDGDMTPIGVKEGEVSAKCINCSYPSPIKTTRGVLHFECPMCHRKVHNPNPKSRKTMVVDYAGDKDIYKKKSYISWFLSKPTALGLGDVCVPGACIASIAIVYGNIWVFALIGCCAGLLFNMVVLMRLRRALPALPLIFLGMMVGLGIGILII